jgi:hypothetical protein
MTRFRDDCLAHAYPSDEQSVHIDAEEWARLSQDLA